MGPVMGPMIGLVLGGGENQPHRGPTESYDCCPAIFMRTRLVRLLPFSGSSGKLLIGLADVIAPTLQSSLGFHLQSASMICQSSLHIPYTSPTHRLHADPAIALALGQDQPKAAFVPTLCTSTASIDPLLQTHFLPTPRKTRALTELF